MLRIVLFVLFGIMTCQKANCDTAMDELSRLSTQIGISQSEYKNKNGLEIIEHQQELASQGLRLITSGQSAKKNFGISTTRRVTPEEIASILIGITQAVILNVDETKIFGKLPSGANSSVKLHQVVCRELYNAVMAIWTGKTHLLWKNHPFSGKFDPEHGLAPVLSKINIKSPSQLRRFIAKTAEKNVYHPKLKEFDVQTKLKGLDKLTKTVRGVSLDPLIGITTLENAIKENAGKLPSITIELIQRDFEKFDPSRILRDLIYVPWIRRIVILGPKIYENDLDHKYLRDIPEVLMHLSHLKKLTFSGFGIKRIPKTLRQLRELRKLNVNFHDIEDVPDWPKEKMKKLKRFKEKPLEEPVSDD